MIKVPPWLLSNVVDKGVPQLSANQYRHYTIDYDNANNPYMVQQL